MMLTSFVLVKGDEAGGVKLLSHDTYLSRSCAKPRVTLLWKQPTQSTELLSLAV